MRENDDERRTDDLFLFLYETVFWLLSRGVVIAPRRRRRRARVSIIARESIVHGRCFVVFRVSQPLSFFYSDTLPGQHLGGQSLVLCLHNQAFLGLL